MRPNLGVLQIGIRARVIENQILSCQIQRIPQSPTRRYPVHLLAPSSPDYVIGPEEPEQAPLSPEFVPEPVYLEFMPPKDDVLPAKKQPLPAPVSLTADSPGYIPESDIEKDDDEDLEEDPADYPTNRDDEEEEEPSEDEADDEDEDDEEEEEEHPAPAESVPPPPVHRTKARISILAQAPVPFLSKEEVERFLAISTPPPSPLTPLSSPLPQIPSSPLPISPPLPVSSPTPPASPTYPLPEVCLPRQNRLCIALGLRYKVGESSSAPTARPTGGFRADYGLVATLDDEIRHDPKRDVGYGITDTWDEMLVGMPGAPVTDDTEFGRWMIEFATMVRQDTDEIYRRLDEAQNARAREDRLSHEVWGWSMNASNTLGSEVRALRTTMLAQQAEIGALREKMAPKRATRSTPATTTTTTSVTNAQLKALIDQGVADALAACDADISMNGDDSHNSGTSVRRQAPPTCECTYPDIMKCKPLYFKGTK
ncbi:hypothetical protein Tco_0064351 [Tanacetum coccineum]